ncbi:MAG: molecular chaperone HtpG [Lentisphaerae bacterium]|nr:molecular chaperone HtpG [Lentisphaerota bacterium]
MSKKTRRFKTEVQQLLDLVIHSLYSKKEIFLRELISNASDAIDRAKFEALTSPDLVEAGETLGIHLSIDKEARTLTLRDNGIGMTADEVEQNIGTIANSGSRKFLEQIREQPGAADVELIGQFGVGFYASFMVADRVTLVTRRAGQGHNAVRWVSDGTGDYTLEDADKADRGTEITLHLRDGMDEFLDEWRLRQIVKSYSDYIVYPILLDKPAPAAEAKKDEKPDDEADDDDGKPLNSMKAIWRRDRKQVTPEEYNEFYTHISHDHHAPLETIHFAVEGGTEFRALLYVPAQAPFDLFMRDRKRGLHLYVKNVFINDDCQELLPEYLRFIKGVVDSSDLPLNVSREMLQDDAIPRQIRKNLVGKVLGVLRDMLDKRPDDYRKFFVQFGKVLKEGLAADFENADKLKDLLLYPTSKTSGADTITLRQYVERMPQGQKDIYWLSADSVEMALHSPHLEVFRKQDREVLFWVDPIDEWVAEQMRDYDGKPLHAIDRGDLTLDGVEEPKAEAEKHSALLKRIQEDLDADIQSVRFSSRLTDSACCLVTDAHGMSPSMERLMKAMNQEAPKAKRILELNPTHPLVSRIEALYAEDANSPRLKEYVELLHGQALLQEGSALKDPARFVRLLGELMVRA